MKRIMQVLSLLATAVALVMFSVTPASAATVRNPSSVCLTPYGGGTSNGTYIVAWQCNGDASQQWEWYGYLIKNKKSGKCLAPEGGKPHVNGTQLTLWTCSSSSDKFDLQSFIQRNNPSSIMTGFGKCIAPYGGSLGNGTNITLWTCDGGSSQVWSL